MPLPEVFQYLIKRIDAKDKERRLGRGGTNQPACSVSSKSLPTTEASKEAFSDNEPRLPEYQLITTAAELKAGVDLLEGARYLAIDTETTGLNPLEAEIRLIQIAAPETPVLVIDCFRLPEDSRGPLKDLLAGGVAKTFHNAKFDLKFLKHAGLPVNGKIFDTMLAERLLTAGLTNTPGASLKALAKKYLGVDLSKEEQVSDWGQADLTTEQLRYAALDAAILLDLRPKLAKNLNAYDLVRAATLEFECVPALVDMELNGMLVDQNKWRVLSSKMEQEQAETAERTKKLLGDPGINLNSPKQVLEALKAHGIDVSKTDKETLKPLADEHPVIKVLLEYKAAAKIVNSFTKKYPEHISPVTGRLHPTYKQMGAATGRMSCVNPNLQQVPKGSEIRSCFIASPGNRLVIADYSQIELRVMAQISQDKRMLEAYKHGGDLHKLTASLITGTPIDEVTKEQRQAAKAINFGMVYGMGATGLKDYAKNSYGVTISKQEAEKFKQAFLTSYPGVQKYFMRMGHHSQTRTLSGRRRLWDGQPKTTQLYNTPIQGTAADIIKQALGWLSPRLAPTEALIIGVVHDEIILDVPVEQAEQVANILKDTMEEAGAKYLTSLPVVADTKIASNWSEK
ncbi:DNA polymerase-1 [Methanococcoides vulcani]|uniref:DNA-directed DNA polymerase n=1 Tax=Methanococcoides vulcani TaxID=1353158 RepID=A0A1I0A0T4_9EURY|nr:bifunctional 3'-5' exonuclease/DNA polymerase [Methanococcoides vulcani]SES87702.1 DNA polymerase-1 [Methanococcoides vulcani]